MALRLDKTCNACPEQYDAFYGDRQVGYLRLRHGYFTVECPDVYGDIVFEASPSGDGIFEEHERPYHLLKARLAIARWILQKGLA